MAVTAIHQQPIGELEARVYVTGITNKYNVRVGKVETMQCFEKVPVEA